MVNSRHSSPFRRIGQGANANGLIWKQENVCASVGRRSAGAGEPSPKSRAVRGTLSLRHGTLRKPVYLEWHSEASELPDWVIADVNSNINTADGKDGTAGSFEVYNGESSSASSNSSSNQSLSPAPFYAPLNELRSFRLRFRQIGGTKQITCQFNLLDGSCSVPFVFLSGGSSSLMEALQRFVTLKRSARDNDIILVSDLKAHLLEKSVATLLNDRNSNDFMARLALNPYGTAMSSLGRVTNFFADKVAPKLPDDVAVEREAARERMRAMQREADQLHVSTQDSFQVVSKDFELPPRPDVPRGDLVTEQVWNSYMNRSDGRFEDTRQRQRELKHTIFRGGIDDKLRPLVWRYLLDYYPYGTDEAELEKLKTESTERYEIMRKQWQTINIEQENRFSAFRDRKALIEKDVMRSDKCYVKAGTEGEHLRQLNDILMTYSMYNFDLGYVQGMSDLLSPLLVVLDDEVASFWCFVGFMEKIHRNFEMDQQHIKTQLMHLRDLLMIVKPEFLSYLETHESDNMFFCFRWILIWFKREFSFDDIKSLWEILWTEMPCKNFHLVFCIAILESQAAFITENKYGFTEILKHMNELSLSIDLLDHVRLAEGIYHQLAAVQDKLPPHICEILGFSLPADRCGSGTLAD